MMELLSRWFIRDRDNVTDPRVRRAYGQLCGFLRAGTPGKGKNKGDFYQKESKRKNLE